MDSLLQYVAQSTSTNHDLMEEVLHGAPHGRAIYTDHQSQGRGRQGRPWTSPPGDNLALSIAVVGERYRTDLALIPLATGVAVAELLEEMSGCTIALKWPNDLLVREKKLCGILCEGVQKGVQFHGVVVGIGINVNMERAALPEALRDRATSIVMETGTTLDLRVLAERTRLAVLQEIDALADGGKPALLRRWQKRDVTLDRRVHILAQDAYGTAEGIAPNGALRVRCDDGRIVQVQSGEVHLLPR